LSHHAKKIKMKLI